MYNREIYYSDMLEEGSLETPASDDINREKHANYALIHFTLFIFHTFTFYTFTISHYHTASGEKNRDKQPNYALLRLCYLYEVLSLNEIKSN